MEAKEATHVVQDGTGDLLKSLLNCTQSGRSVCTGERSQGQLEDLDSWNPMSDDFESEAFNSYKEPSTTDFVNAFPGRLSQTSQSSTKSSLKTYQGDVRLFVGRIPQQVTQEGLYNLFCQVGKLSSCNLIPQHNKDTKIGFVGYETMCEAEAAIQKFDGFDLGEGHRLKVTLALSKQKPAFGDMRDISSDCANRRIHKHIDDSAASRNESLQNGASDCLISNSKLASTGQPCSFCGHLGLKWCSTCKTPYCSRECQRNDWPKHKRICLQQPLSNRKPTTPPDSPRTGMKTDTYYTPPEGVAMSHTTSAVLPLSPGDPEQPTDELSTSTATEDHHTEEKKDLDDLETGELFDVYNAEMFAKMMGFDPTPVKVVENGEDSDCADNDSSNAQTSAFSTDNCMHQDPFPEASVSQTKVPVLYTAITESSAQGTVPECSIELESVTSSTVDIASAENCVPQHPTCAKGEKRFFIKQINMENVPPEDFFEVVVTDVENPGCFWAQLCTPEAIERQNKLKKLLQVSYCNSTFVNYVPSSGEVCVAQFSLDSCWYRVKVDFFNNTGTLRVTYIDFGNHEDIALDKVRRISEDLARLPRQALKLSLHGITDISSSVQWSSESTTFLKSKVLGIKCKVRVCGQHDEMLSVKLSVPDDSVNSDNTVNEDFMKAGFAETRHQQPSSPHTPMQADNDEKAWFSNIARQQANRPNNKQDHKNECEQQRDNPNQDKCSHESGTNTSLHMQHSNPPGNSSEPQTRWEPFEAIINAIVSPWEFYAMKTDKQLLGKLESLMEDLNQHMSGNSSPPECPALLPTSGDICAARFSVDSVWYRALILEHVSGGFRVRYIDFGNSEVVPYGDICPLPQQFQSFPPLSLTCSLAGVRKPRGQNWSVEAIQQFKSLVAEKPFLCRIVYTHGDANIVELLDPCRGGEQTVANSLISSGLADVFISRDGKKQQSDVKKGPQFAAQRRRDIATAVAKSPLDDHTRSPCNLQLPGFQHPHGKDVAARDDYSNSFKGDGVESAVFEQAIQAALPQDVRFDVLVTEVVSPGLIYCQLGTVESLQNVAKLTQDMNLHYNAVSYPPFVLHKNSLCAAHFAESGDWCRAFITEVSTDGSVHVHYLDYGNTEIVPPVCMRPLLEQFSFEALPFSALRCSLANIASPDASGWSDKAVAFVKAHLPLFSLCGVRLVGKQKGKLFLDIIAKETGESVSETMVNQGLAIAMVNVADKRCNVSPLESLVYQPAVQSASLPQDRSLFDVMVTEVTKSGVFFIQVADHDTGQNLKKLSEDLNTFYHSSQWTSYEPRPNQFCAAHFAKTGDWCRALVREISSDGLVQVHYVDYGNTEKLPISSIQPLMDNFTTFPFFALPCSLANISQPEPPGWAEEAMKLFKENVPIFHRLSAKLVGKRRGMLYIDFLISKDHPRYLSQLLLQEGFAERLTRVHKQDGGTRRDIQRDLSRPQEKSLLRNSAASSCLEADLVSNGFESAYQSIQVLDSFDAMLTNVVSPDLLFIQVLRHEKVESLKQLSEGSSNPPPPMEDLKCSLSGIRPAYSSGWSDTACELLLSQVPLFSRVNVKVIRKENGLLVIDASPRNSAKQETLSQFLVSQDIARWEALPSLPKKHMQPLGQRGYSGENAELPKQSHSGAICSGSNRIYSSVIPLVDVSQNVSYKVIITEVQQPNRIFFQVTSKENEEGLAALSVMLNTHCSTADNNPYKPEVGELCCARFTDDGMWYRAVVEQKLSDSRMLVMFVDYGNQDSVPVESVRRIATAFTRFPLQARQCFLTGIQPQSFWSQDAVNFLKGRLKGRRFIAEIESVTGKELGLRLFEVSPGQELHGVSINQDLIQHNFAGSHEVCFYRRLELNDPKEDQFDVLITEAIHPGEIWAQVMYAESHHLLNLLMRQINQHCMSTTVPNIMPNPGQECCALFALDNTWYRARVLEYPKPGEILVHYVDFGNSELVTPDKIRSTKEEFFSLPAQAIKLSLANVRPACHVWNQEAVEWLKHIINKKLKTKVVHRLPQHLVVLLEDWAAPEGPCNINEELVRMKFAVKC